MRDAARPGSYVGNVLGSCAREAASLQRNGRPARGEAATSYRNHAADVRNRPVCGAHSDQGVRGAECRMHSNRCECVLRGDHRESEAQSFRFDPWVAVRRARLDPMQPVPDSGDGNPPGF